MSALKRSSGGTRLPPKIYRREFEIYTPSWTAVISSAYPSRLKSSKSVLQGSNSALGDPATAGVW